MWEQASICLRFASPRFAPTSLPTPSSALSPPLRAPLQPKRLGALNKFKAGERSILICTDVASRGLDIPSVDMVINYDIPTNSKVGCERCSVPMHRPKGTMSIWFRESGETENVSLLCAVRCAASLVPLLPYPAHPLSLLSPPSAPLPVPLPSPLPPLPSPPPPSQDYIHRVGRTARAGRSGRAISVVTQYDVELYQRIEQLIGAQG